MTVTEDGEDKMIAIGFGKTDVGRHRDNNEDAFHADDAAGLFVVCDGMGGHKGGEIASKLAIRTVSDALGGAGNGFADDSESQIEAVAGAMRSSHTAVVAEGTANRELSGMGCAMSLIKLFGGRAVIGHVGDTRIYLYRDGEIRQLTNDHTFVGELVRSGSLEPGAVSRHPHAHVLTRAIGAGAELDVDAFPLDVRRGDRFLLCSDGLSAYADDPSSLADRLGEAELSSIPTLLVDWANDSGGRDNVTAVVVEVTQ